MTDRQDDPLVRKAEPKDLPALVACSAALFAEDAGERDPSVNVDWPREHGLQRLAAGIDDSSRLLLVAEASGLIVHVRMTVMVTAAAASVDAPAR